MAKKGEKKHLKRLNVPKAWKMPRKGKKWAVTTSPGPHSKRESLPLAVSLRENLKIARTKKEAEKILGSGRVLVDGKVRRDPKYPVGFMDVVEIPKTGESWRVLFDGRGYLHFHEIEGKESEFKLAKVVGKTPFKGERLQISLSDGRVLMGEFDSVEVGDTVKINVPEHEIQGSVPCEEGNLVFITGGSNVGKKGKIKKILRVEGPAPNHFLITTDDEEFQSPEEHVFVVGEEKSEVSLPEVIE